LAGHLDVSDIAVAGHSFGGLTALQVAEQDSRVRAAVVIDGVMDDDTTALADTPVLIVDAGRKSWSADERRVWNRLRGPRYAVNLEDSAHTAPSDLVWLAKGAIATGKMTPEDAVSATRDYVAAFLDSSLRGTPPDPMLTSRSPRYPHVEVKVTHRAGSAP
jgi:pimeloyl-ACP methyl ester carboxylesterase